MFYSKSTGGFYDPAIHTQMPKDAVEITVEEHAALLGAQSIGKVIAFDESTQKPVANDPPPPTSEQIITQYTAAIQARLDNFARTRGYDNCLSACTYATSQVAKFAAEGQYMVNARDTTWADAYAIMADVQAGTRPMPSLEGLIAELGALTWPV